MPALAVAVEDAISEEQRKVSLGGRCPCSAEDFRRISRWWELEASRGYGSSRRSLLYATNMLRAAQTREADGSERAWDPAVDARVEECGKCSGPVDGPWSCGGCLPDTL